MIKNLRMLNATLMQFGIDLKKLVTSLGEVPSYFQTLKEFKKQGRDQRLFAYGRNFLCLDDRRATSGVVSGHYFHQDLLVARRIFENKPKAHLDIGSRVDGFVAHVASFRPIEVIDLRPVKSKVSNIRFIQLDITRELSGSFIHYCDSFSSLRALEHFGLGRYGDRIQYYGYLAGRDNMYRILKRRGKLYISVAVGTQRIEFNAHRVFSLRYLLGLLKDRYRIDRFSYVDDDGALHENVGLGEEDASKNFGCHFGWGIFEMTKL